MRADTGVHETAALLKANRRGIALMSAAMVFFVVNDAIVKLVSATLPTAQLVFLRGLMAIVLVAAVARHLGALRGVREAARAPVVA